MALAPRPKEFAAMARTGKLRVAMEELFPFGAFVVSDVEKIKDWDRSTADHEVQQLDKESGLPLWEVVVHDADPEARKQDRTVTVKIAAKVQPVPPEALPGLPF